MIIPGKNGISSASVGISFIGQISGSCHCICWFRYILLFLDVTTFLLMSIINLCAQSKFKMNMKSSAVRAMKPSTSLPSGPE